MSLPTQSRPASGNVAWQKTARRIRVPLGLLLTVAYVWLAKPTWASIASGLALVVAGLGVRALAAGTLRKKAALATTGPYAYTRNPLYVGSFLMAIGFAVAGLRLEIGVLMVAMFFVIYLPTIRSEEDFLRGKYPEFMEYERAVPRLLPRLTPAYPGGKFSFEVYVKNREYQAALGSALILAALVARILLRR